LGDDVRLVVLQGGDLGEVALEGEEDPQEGPAQDGRREEGGDGGAAQGEDPGRGEAGARHHQERLYPPPGARNKPTHALCAAGPRRPSWPEAAKKSAAEARSLVAGEPRVAARIVARRSGARSGARTGAPPSVGRPGESRFAARWAAAGSAPGASSSRGPAGGSR